MTQPAPHEPTDDPARPDPVSARLRSDGAVRVDPCTDGPLLVRGATEVLDETGTPHEVRRPVVAVCTCRRSQRKPWCDGTHKFINRKPS